MKRVVSCLLLVVLLLTACSASRSEMLQPVKFYYGAADARSGEYGAEDGALFWELRDLGPVLLDAGEILGVYLQGPESPGLRAPVPKGTTVENVLLQDGTLTIEFSEELQQLSGVERTLAAACLVRTMTQFSDIDSVALYSGGRPFLDGTLRMEDFLLLDDTATSDAVTLKLYFGSPDGRYLVEETRSGSFQSDSEIPLYIVQQLREGSLSQEGGSLFPEGTRVLGVQLQDGVCTVNLSESFLWYQPTTHVGARRLVLSVTNALTELPEIACVRFLCSGDPISYYMGLDLTEPVYRDERAIVMESTDTEDVTLYMPCGKQERLAPVPMLLSRTSGRNLETEVVNALLSAETINSYRNPFPEGTMLLSAETRDGLCTVVFNAAFAMTDSEEQEQAAIRSVVATLCALENVEQVTIELQNGKLTTIDSSEALTVVPAWLLP